MINEDKLESLCLNWFQDNGWNYVDGHQISPDGEGPEREDYRVVVLKDRLATAVARLNPGLPQSAIDEVLHLVADPDHPSLDQNRRILHRFYNDWGKVIYGTIDSKNGDDSETIDGKIIVTLEGCT